MTDDDAAERPTAGAVPTDGELAPSEDPRPDGLRRADSLVVLNTGNGKGKSSSAFGMMIRAVARGWDVAVVQFVKSGTWNTGEQKIAERLGVEWHAFGDGFTWDSDDLTNDRAHAAEGWAAASAIIAAGEHQLVVLDEVVAPIRDRPRHVNVIVTGRDAAPELVELADTATEMVELKHAYQQGIRAMRGLDY